MAVLGDRLYRLSRRPAVLGISVLLALLAAVLSAYRPTLSPLGMQQRNLQIAAASTEILIGRPNALPNNSIAYEAAVNAGLLAANVMISPAVTDIVGRKLGIDPQAIQATPPATDNVPAALIQPGPSGGPEDIFALPDHYKLELEQDPTSPMLFVYTQAPTGADAVRMANAFAQGLVAYLKQLQTRHAVPVNQQLSVEQLGGAEGGTAHTGGLTQIMFLVFIATLLLALATFSKFARLLEQRGLDRSRAQRAALVKIATYSSE
jgi:hypothetical protein